MSSLAHTRTRPRDCMRRCRAAFVSALVLCWAPIAFAAEPVDVVFVLDNSGSMQENDPAFLTREAVRDFARALSANESLEGRIAIVLFDHQAHLVQSLIPAREAVGPGTLSSAFAALDFSGQRTNSAAGIERALYELRENGRDGARQAIIFLSDGKIDTGDAQNDLALARWLREDLAEESDAHGIRIFGVAFTDAADYQLMQALAQRTNGRYYRAFEARELANTVEDILSTVYAAPIESLPDAEQEKPLPNVASAPLDQDSAPSPGPGTRLWGWLPVAILLVGAAVYFRRKGLPGVSAEPRFAFATAPAAQLLDPGGMLGESIGVLSLRPDRTTIGRDPKNDLVLPDDTISSEHALIEVKDGRYWLQNLRATNGTRIGNRRLAAEECVPLKGGDHVRFADIDLMFVVEGYIPGGATVYLSSSTTAGRARSTRADVTEMRPGSPRAGSIESSRPTGANVAPPEPHPRTHTDPDEPDREAAFAKERERLDPASVLDLDREMGGNAETATDSDVGNRVLESDPHAEAAVARAEAVLEALDDASTPPEESESPAPLELLSTPSPDEPEPETEEDAWDPETGPTAELEIGQRERPAPAEAIASPPPPRTSVETQALRECMDAHLDRVTELSPAFAAFVERAFGTEMRSALPVAAAELLARANQSERIEEREYTTDRIRYVICAVPDDMERARRLFVDSYGGFTRMLTEQLGAESFRAEGCEILALLSFGRGKGEHDTPWVSLTIVPDEGQEPRIDLLSYEFLTRQERREIEPSIDEQISQSGLA